VKGTKNIKRDQGNVLCKLQTKNLNNWVIDSSVIYHMTYLNNNLDKIIQPRSKEILNTNGVSSPVVGTRNVRLTLSLRLKNTLLIPSLSIKFFSIGLLTEDLNCVVLMYLNFYIF
jgi:hypothetical protein